MEWYVVYTRSRCEKKVNETLSNKGFESYCPTQEVLSQWSDRKKKIIVPVFKSYVFIKTTEKSFKTVKEDSNIVNFVYWLGKPAKIREVEIEAIKQLLQSYLKIEVKNTAVKIGDSIYLSLNTLPNTVATIVKIHNNTVVLHLPQLGLNLKTTLSVEEIAKLKSNSIEIHDN